MGSAREGDRPSAGSGPGPRHPAEPVAVPAPGLVGAPAASLRARQSAVVTLQRAAGNAAAARLLAGARRPAPARAATVQRQPGGGTKTADPIQEAIDKAAAQFPLIAPDLAQVTLRGTVQEDRTIVTVHGRGSLTYPSQIRKAEAGFYAYKWDADGNHGRNDLINLATGDVPAVVPQIAQAAGEKELRDLRKQRIGVVWVTRTVTAPPKPPPPTPDQLQLELPPGSEISGDDFRRMMDILGEREMTILGLTGGVFHPGQEYGRPLNFTYHTHDGVSALVTRKLVGRDFHYVVPISTIQNYLRAYPFEYAGVSAAAWEPIYRLLFDIGVSFIPVIGPLYMLAQAGRAAYHAYHHWDEMSGWEKGLVGVNILLAAVPVIRTARRVAAGTAAYREGVQSLVSAGLPQAEARRLMIMSGVFQSQKATTTIVDTLGDVLRRGERLTTTQLAELQTVFHKMLQKLPTAERNVIAASFATANLRTAREFLGGLELTERHLAGLRRLTPEALAALKTAAREEPILVQRVATWAAASEDVAKGVNELQLAVKPGQLAKVLSDTGEDALRTIGEAGGLSPKLIEFVKRARTASDAYRRLMQGSTRGGQKIMGLAESLARLETQALTPELTLIRRQFGKTYLTPEQLGGLARLSGTTRAALRDATDAQLRWIATATSTSSGTATAVEHLANRLGQQASRRLLPGVLERVGGGTLEAAGAHGIQLSDELIARMARQSSSAKAARVLLEGFQPRAGARVAGLLDDIAGAFPHATAAEQAIAKVEYAALRGELFARWALRNPAQVRKLSAELADGVEAIGRLRPADAQAQLSGLYRALGGNQEVAADIIKTIGQLDKQHGSGIGLGRMIAELSAGEANTMGASLTFSFAAKRVRTITQFEQEVAVAGRTRRYDLVADGLQYEFKYWLGFGGRPAAQAADEFARDVMLHAGDGFSRLRWVISRDAVGNLPAIQSMMRGVLSRREVREVLKAQGLVLADVRAALDAALQGRLLEFF